MSIATQSESYDCGECDDQFDHPPIAGSFCSTECHHAHRAGKQRDAIFERLEHDHRFCGTCFAQTKEIEAPPEGTSLVIPPALDPHDKDWENAKDVLIGYQHWTKHAVEGETGKPKKYHNDLIRATSICRCGNCSHRHAEDTIRDRLAFTAGHNLLEAIDELRREGKTDVDVDREAFFDALLGEPDERRGHREALAEAIRL